MMSYSDLARSLLSRFRYIKKKQSRSRKSGSSDEWKEKYEELKVKKDQTEKKLEQTEQKYEETEQKYKAMLKWIQEAGLQERCESELDTTDKKKRKRHSSEEEDEVTYSKKKPAAKCDEDTLESAAAAIQEAEKKPYMKPEIALENENKGDEAYQKGDFPAAIKHYTEAIKRNPDDAKLYNARAACYAKLLKFQLSIDDCDKCVNLNPTFVEGYLRKGMALMRMHDASRALNAYVEALRLEPNSDEAIDGIRRASAAIREDPAKAQDRVINDPEIQAILADPAMRLILEQMTQDPKAVRGHLKNPNIADKVSKLLEAGVIGMP